ncbi:MAG: DsbA family protein [Solirubrobacteraceae bacterium]
MQAAQPIFFYDIGDPHCYLVAERILATLGELDAAPEWEPVHGAVLGIEPPAIDAVELGEAVATAGLQPLRMPRTWPPDSELAMLAATFAKGGGRAVAFSLAAFRQVFAGGRDLNDESTVLLAAAACEMHPKAVLKAIGMRSVADSLDRAGRRAHAAGVRELPAIGIGALLCQGPGALDLAERRLRDAIGCGT